MVECSEICKISTNKSGVYCVVVTRLYSTQNLIQYCTCVISLAENHLKIKRNVNLNMEGFIFHVKPKTSIKV